MLIKIPWKMRRQESKPNENPNTNSHMRTQVYQIIEELYGHPIDREKI